MMSTPEATVSISRTSEAKPSPNVYVGLSELMWVFTPWTWRNILLNMTAAREWSDVGLPPLRKDAANDLPRPFRFSLKTWIPLWFVSLMVQNLFVLCIQFEFRSDRHLHGSVDCEGAVQV